MSGHHKWSDIKHKRNRGIRIMRHTRPLVEDAQYDTLPASFNDLQYTKDMLSKFEQIVQMQEEELAERRESQLNLLKMITDLAKERNDLQDTLAINYEMYGDLEVLLKRAEEAERLIYEEVLAHERTKQILDETQQQLGHCEVSLHDQQKHQLGLMCAEQTVKLDKISKLVQRAHQSGDADWLAAEIQDIIDD